MIETNRLNVSFWARWTNSLSFEASGLQESSGLPKYKIQPFKQSNLSLIAADWCNPSATVISQLSVPELYPSNCASMHH